MLTHKRESKTRKAKDEPIFPELVGTLFEHPNGRIWILLWDREWFLCHAWAGYKGLDIRDKKAVRSYDGFVDNNIFRVRNYYWDEPLNTNSKTEQGVLNAATSRGYKLLPEKMNSHV